LLVYMDYDDIVEKLETSEFVAVPEVATFLEMLKGKKDWCISAIKLIRENVTEELLSEKESGGGENKK
jgi:hypothetical protein